jgi:hypothetical protein
VRAAVHWAKGAAAKARVTALRHPRKSG